MEAKRSAFFALAMLCHIGACYEFISYDYNRGNSLANKAWVLLLALAVVFWILRARIRGTGEEKED
jgi:hypothetical protein